MSFTKTRHWRKMKPAARLRWLMREYRRLEDENFSMRAQISHAAGATQDMAAHSRALEVQNHALRLNNNGTNVFFENPRSSGRAAMLVEVPELKTISRKLVDSQPTQITTKL